ncbi:Inactive purple acid phosphatase [Melia azedarach]|uniref:Inactive purple acid phosphatase n=1 Tax=Melia azedarach TaxID=155640 RepID=A0ACC1XEK4_MELAZ|nr:Inactive purple acid phosphatase [Melia azedarach]
MHTRLLHQNQISQKLLVNHDQIYLKKFPDLPLRFRSDGTFKILQVADMHYGNGRMTRCRDVLSPVQSTIIDAERPDFIAFTGDNIFGTSASDAAESLFGAFGPAIESGLPWAAVLGNHDQKSTMNRRELIDFISLLDYSVAQTNPPDLEDDIDGLGNYDLKVYGPPGSILANSSILNLFFLDSGDREIFQGVQTYGWIKESQLRWLRGVSQGQKQNSNLLEKSWLPSLAFFHILIPEIKQLQNQKITGQFQ